MKEAVYLCLIGVVLLVGLVVFSLISNDKNYYKLHKTMMSNEKSIRDSIDKKLTQIQKDKDQLLKNFEEISRTIKTSENRLNSKITDLKNYNDDPSFKIYIDSSNISLLNRLQSGN